MTVVRVLPGQHTSPETAYVIQDYPYGRTLRCKKRIWIESVAGKGERVISQTTNPKHVGDVWNSQHKSTYDAVKVLYLDEKEHVAIAAMPLSSILYSHDTDSQSEIDQFEATYKIGFTEYATKFWEAAQKRRAVIRAKQSS